MTEKKILHAYYPGKKFPAVSITGKSCGLNCSHCGGHYLDSMISATDPEKLYDTCKRISEEGGTGILLSGGCDDKGKIDINPFYSTLRQVKKELSLTINIHTGLLGSEEIEELSRIKIDTVSFDLVADDSVISDVYHLENKIDDYYNCLKSMQDAGLEVVPHICIGLNPDSNSGELKAIDLLKEFRPERLIFIVFIPTKGTPMENMNAPEPDNVSEVISYAKSQLPGTELVLGCMRPRRPRQYEAIALDAGIDGIVLPSKRFVEELKNEGWQIIMEEKCCALP